MPNNNGGIIGKSNKTSFGKCKQTVITSNTPSAVTTQPGTRVVKTLIVAGGGGGGGICTGQSKQGQGGGGAGGLRNLEINVCGNTPYTATIGAGGAASPGA